MPKNENVIQGGYILLARRIRESDIWLKKPATWLKAWLHILLSVPWTGPNRGKAFFSWPYVQGKVPDLTEANWRRCLEWLEDSGSIRKHKSPCKRGVWVTVLTYPQYQAPANYTETTPREKTSASRSPTARTAEQQAYETALDTYARELQACESWKLNPKATVDYKEMLSRLERKIRDSLGRGGLAKVRARAKEKQYDT